MRYGQTVVSNGVCWDDITIDAGFSYQRELKPHWAIVGGFAEPNLDEPAALLRPRQTGAVAFERNMPVNR